MRCPSCREEHPAGTAVCPKTQQRIAGILPEGTELDGKYRVQGVLGTGGMAVVYRAEHMKIGRPVALKFLLPEFVAFPDLVERVEREARAAGGVDHPNVVEIVDLGTTTQYGPYIAMELLRGEDLATFVEKHGGRLGMEQAAEIARQVLAALGAAHSKGVVHRDLKPENIFITDDDSRMRVKVLDFGISKLTEESGKLSSLTRTGTVMGTPQFMAPEQAAGARDQDYRVDIYACGVVVYAMLCGQLPYEAENYNLLINDILNKTPRPLMTRDPSLDPRLSDIVMRALARNPDDRFQTAKEMQDALVGWIESAAARAARKAEVVPPVPRAAPAPRAAPGAKTMQLHGGTPPHASSGFDVPVLPPPAAGYEMAIDDEPTTSFAIPEDPVLGRVEVEAKVQSAMPPVAPSPKPATPPVPKAAAAPATPVTADPAAVVNPLDLAPLRAQARTPFGWENTPPEFTPPKPVGRRIVIGALIGINVLAVWALVMSQLLPHTFNMIVRTIGAPGLAVHDPTMDDPTAPVGNPVPPTSRAAGAGHDASTGETPSSGSHGSHSRPSAVGNDSTNDDTPTPTPGTIRPQAAPSTGPTTPSHRPGTSRSHGH